MTIVYKYWVLNVVFDLDNDRVIFYYHKTQPHNREGNLVYYPPPEIKERSMIIWKDDITIEDILGEARRIIDNEE